MVLKSVDPYGVGKPHSYIIVSASRQHDERAQNRHTFVHMNTANSAVQYTYRIAHTTLVHIILIDHLPEKVNSFAVFQLLIMRIK